MTSETSTQESNAPADHECQFAAYHGYCVTCGADGWTPEDRRRIRAAQAAVRRG